MRVPLDPSKLWLKADCGHRASPLNRWVDQTTNGNHAFHKSTDVVAQEPIWVETEMNGRPAIHFQGTNALRLPSFMTNWTEGEVYVVVESLGSTSTNWAGLWLLGGGSLPSYYPYTNSTIVENFGRTNASITTGVSAILLSTPHLYNVMSKPNSWISRLNNAEHYSTNVNVVAFQATSPRIGWGQNVDYFRGYISELLIFDRELTAAERDAVAATYLKKRFDFVW